MTGTNGWDFLQTLATVGIPALVTIITYRLTRKGQDPKLDEIHKTVNGKSDKQERRIAELEALLEDRQRDP